MIPPNLVKFTANSSGTGAVTVGSAVAGFRGREALTDGGVYGYSIQQEADWEFGRGTYLAATGSFVRSPYLSSTGGTAINLQPNATVAIVLLAEDLLELLAGLIPTVPIDTQALQAEINRATSAEAFLATRIVAAALGIQPYDTVAAMNADTSKPIGSYAVVSANQTFYRYTSGGWVRDDTFKNALVSFVQPLVDRAEAAAKGIVPRATALTVTTTSGTTNLNLTLPSGLVLADGDIVEFRAPSDLTGPFTVTTAQFGTVALLNRVASPYTGLAFPAYSTVRIQYNGNGGVFGEYATTTPLYVGQATDARASAALTGTSLLANGTPAIPKDGNPNNLTADVPNAANGTTFNVLAVATNTGTITLTAGGVSAAVANGGGVDLVAGDFVAGTVYPLQYSAGGGKFATAGATFPARVTAPPNGTNDPDLSARPWGAVSFSGATRTVTPVTKYLLLAGSSNANADYVPPAQRPDLVMVAALNKYFPADGLAFTGINVSAPGAPFAAIAGQLANSADYVAGRVTWAHLLFGMNDARTLFYHSQGGVLAELNVLRDSIASIRAKGVEPVLYTIFPPDPRASSTALDPLFFSTPGSLPSGGTTSSMEFPAIRPAPVDPETQMYPPASAPTVVQPWTSSGIQRTGYKRIWHVNREIRRAAADLGCVLIDIEQSTYRTVIEPLPDLGAALETYYETGNPLHPRAALYDVAVTPLLDAWALSVAQGRSDRRVYA